MDEEYLNLNDWLDRELNQKRITKYCLSFHKNLAYFIKLKTEENISKVVKYHDVINNTEVKIYSFLFDCEYVKNLKDKKIPALVLNYGNQIIYLYFKVDRLIGHDGLGLLGKLIYSKNNEILKIDNSFNSVEDCMKNLISFIQ